MSVKTLAKQLPLYGQQAVSTALTALSVAGHLRRVRCPVVGAGDETRWVFRTFWSRTARDNEWWNTYLATENATQAACPEPGTPGPSTAPPPPLVPAEDPPPTRPEAPRRTADREMPKPPRTAGAPELAEPLESAAAVSVPDRRTPAERPDTAPAPNPDQGGTAHSTVPTTDRTTAPAAPHSPAYLALARLGLKDNRLTLSADDCAALETQAAEWFARGVDAEYLIAALTAGLPARVDIPVRFVRRRLADKIPPLLPAMPTSPKAATHRILVECADCGAPGRPEALPDGLCRPCRTTRAPEEPIGAPGTSDIGAYIAELRNLLKAP